MVRMIDVKIEGIWIGLGLILVLFFYNYNNDESKSMLTTEISIGDTLEVNLDVSYTFPNSGSPFHLSYTYDKTLESAYIYQLKLHGDKQSSIIKFKIDSLQSSIQPIDTFSIREVEIKPSSFISAMFYTIGLDSFAITTLHNNDESVLYTIVKNHSINKSYFCSEDEYGSISQTYYNSKNQILSNNYMLSCFPIYHYNPTLPEAFTWPNFIWNPSRDKIKGLWSIGQSIPSDNMLIYDILRLGFSIHCKDKIYYLKQCSEHVEVFYPEKENTSFHKLYLPPLTNKIGGKIDQNLVEIYEESDYWIQFVYNRYKNQFYLVQHIGYPYYNVDGIHPREKKRNEITSKLYVLDESFNTIKTVLIPRFKQFSTVLPIFPTKAGVITQKLTRDKTGSMQISLIEIQI